MTQFAAVVRCNPGVARIGIGATTIVGLYGILGTHTSWLPLAIRVSSQVRWSLSNFQGRGQAWRGAIVNDYSLNAFAREAIRAIDQNVGASDDVLVGCSVGVSTILAILAQLKETGRPIPQAILFMSDSPVLQMTSWFHARDQAGLLGETAPREQRLALPDAADLTSQAINHTNQHLLLPLILQRTFVLHGTQDQDLPLSHAEVLVKPLSLPRLHLIKSAGHRSLTQDTEHKTCRRTATRVPFPSPFSICERLL